MFKNITLNYEKQRTEGRTIVRFKKNFEKVKGAREKGSVFISYAAFTICLYINKHL